MFEEQCIIRCLERDRELVTGLLHDCVACFNYSMNQEIQREYPLQLMVSHLNGLTERNLASK